MQKKNSKPMENIKGIGYYDTLYTIDKADGTIILFDFLDKMLVQFCKQSKKYVDETLDAPFAYSEKQLHTMFAPAFANYTSAFLYESPVKRHWSTVFEKSEDSHGWVDYWVRYRNVEFLIEIKHSWTSYKTGKIQDSSQQKWEVANNQFLSLRKEAKTNSQYSRGCFLIIINVFTIFDRISKSKKSQSIEDFDTIDEIFMDYYKGLKPKVNWASKIVFNKAFVADCVDSFGKYDCYYPGLLFMGKISNLY